MKNARILLPQETIPWLETEREIRVRMKPQRGGDGHTSGFGVEGGVGGVVDNDCTVG